MKLKKNNLKFFNLMQYKYDMLVLNVNIHLKSLTLRS